MALGNILSIPKKTKIAATLQGKHLVLAGLPKTGKSSVAAQTSKPIFLATEAGQEFLTDITIAPIASWSEFKQAVTQLATPAAREQFDTVVIDSQTNLAMLLDKFTGQKLSSEKEALDWGSDADWGKGNKTSKLELNYQINKLTAQGYLVISIIHAENKSDFNTGKEYLGTSLPSALWGLVEKSADQVVYLCKERDTKNGPLEYRTYFNDKGGFPGAGGRITPKNVDYVQSNWKDIESALIGAIDQNKIAEVTTDIPTVTLVSEKKTFKELKEDFDKLTAELMEKDSSNADIIREIVETELGPGKKVSKMLISQADILELIISKLSSIIKGE